MSVFLSRALAGVVGVVAVAGLTVVAAPAATAATCSPKATVSQSGSTITGRGHTICRGVPGGEPVTISDDEVAIQRVDPNTGVWYTLANGVGVTTYACLGTATNTFRAVTPFRTSVTITASCG
ncbi:hypothetical protein ABZ816_35910 [Actinosynnema sp. NPDC047251]|uniref:Putative secreted protein n=1 Tax=Saccharothrix espanaensis (strain ATCC 51144 / DSM 44229 / JCM 9112 / NBRC 15066 / NRRL 15764) TaxID=1179773 RepID=K0JUH0_SACES|nr:hypothetical protein [Saccharothrix espanaensis]CCH29127.1 putative secreted protein [Saccharothrix espanaensis DSM 44229]